MKRFRIMAACLLLLVLALTAAGCAVNVENFENETVRQQSEAMLDALVADDSKAAYLLVHNLCSESEFMPLFAQLREMLGDIDSYELKLLSVYVNNTLINGEAGRMIRSSYEVSSGSNRFIMDVALDEQIGIVEFYLTPFEKTDYYVTGILGNMEGASFLQWFFLLTNLAVLAVSAVALVDCARKTIRKKVLWILFLIFGFFTLGLTVSPSVFRINFNLGSFFAYSALIRYGSGKIVIRCMLPLGAICYYSKKRSLLRNAAGAPESTVAAAAETMPPDDPA